MLIIAGFIVIIIYLIILSVIVDKNVSRTGIIVTLVGDNTDSRNKLTSDLEKLRKELHREKSETDQMFTQAAVSRGSLTKNIADLQGQINANKGLAEKASSDNSIRCDSIEIDLAKLAEALGYEYREVSGKSYSRTYKFVKKEGKERNLAHELNNMKNTINKIKNELTGETKQKILELQNAELNDAISYNELLGKHNKLVKVLGYEYKGINTEIKNPIYKYVKIKKSKK